jgi:tryptophan 7-halogenase
MTEAPHIHSIVIAGGGTAGWMAAAALRQALPPSIAITLVESEAIGIVGVGEATIPQIRLFNAVVGLDEDAFIRATQATFKLGIEFSGWSGPGSRYLHAFGPLGRPLGMTGFHQYWLAARAEGKAGSLWDYSLTAQAAARGRFARTFAAPPGPGLPAGLAHAFHFDAALFAAHLRTVCEPRGVMRQEGVIRAVRQDAATGAITALTLEDGREIAGDFFIDCTGFRSLLLGGALGAAFEDWSHWLPCDRALAVPSGSERPLKPYTMAMAHDAGWQWRIPLQHRTGNGLVYSSAFLDDETAAQRLLANLPGPALADPRPLRFTTGRRREAWRANCVALGLAAGFMEPLESTSIHLIQSGVQRLIDLFPAPGASGHAERAAYNRLTGREYVRIRDFLILHYWANARHGEAFWDARRALNPPGTLAEKIALFEEGGRVLREEEELFTEAGWVQVFLGQGIEPARASTLAHIITPEQRAGYLADLARITARTVEALPAHEAFIARHCAAPEV